MTYTSAGFSRDDDEDDDDKQSDDSDTDDTQDDQSDDSGSDDDQSDSGGSDDDSQSDDSDDSGQSDDDSGAQTVANAAPHEAAAHRNMIGDALQRLSDQGIDVDSLAERAGVQSSDVDELSHGDLAGITQYIAQHHPEALQAVESRYPAAQGLLGALTGGGGGIFGRLFGG